MIQDLKYNVPQEWRGPKIHKLYPAIPRSAGKVNFDIFDFNFLFNDPGTKKLIRSGNTIGCFYIESPGMRSLLRKLNVDDFEMLTAASSIIRPGVAESGMMQEFIARHKDPSRRKYFIPEMETYLGDTYGVMIYQEDVIKVAHHIAGLTLEEADLLRRAMSGKMRSHKAMEQITQKFYYHCKERNLTDEQTKELWRQIESFAGYSFCKAHSASFALLSFQVAFLKAHYPAEFMASVLSNGGGFYSPAVYIEESKRMGLKIMQPCINRSRYDYYGRDDKIRIGFCAIKNFSRASAEIIISERKNGNYSSLADFLTRTHLGFEETALLIKCGAMDCLKKTRSSMLRLLDIYIHRRKILEKGYGDLFMNEPLPVEMEGGRDYTIEEKCLHEYESFDYMVTRHPLHFYEKWINNPSVTTADLMDARKGRRVKMIGWYMTSKRIRTRKGDIMKFLSLEDLTGTFEAVIFPRVYDAVAEKTMSMGPYIVEGRVDPADSRNLVVDKLDVISYSILKSSLQKDSVDHNYYGDVEKITEEEFDIVNKLGKEKLRLAYAG
jgi:DNA polymerase III alpha subunit